MRSGVQFSLSLQKKPLQIFCGGFFYVCKMKFYTYIIYSKSSDKYYTGYCSNIETRLEKHNFGATRSTKPGRPWILVYSESFHSKREAIQRESEIKCKKSRIYIEHLIGSSGD